MFHCTNCQILMIKANHEYYCPRCGLVENDYFNFSDKRDGVGIPVPSWKANFKQTKEPYTWKGGRRIIRTNYI